MPEAPPKTPSEVVKLFVQPVFDSLAYRDDTTTLLNDKVFHNFGAVHAKAVRIRSGPLEEKETRHRNRLGSPISLVNTQRATMENHTAATVINLFSPAPFARGAGGAMLRPVTVQVGWFGRVARGPQAPATPAGERSPERLQAVPWVALLSGTGVHHSRHPVCPPAMIAERATILRCS